MLYFILPIEDELTCLSKSHLIIIFAVVVNNLKMHEINGLANYFFQYLVIDRILNQSIRHHTKTKYGYIQILNI